MSRDRDRPPKPPFLGAWAGRLADSGSFRRYVLIAVLITAAVVIVDAVLKHAFGREWLPEPFGQPAVHQTVQSPHTLEEAVGELAQKYGLHDVAGVTRVDTEAQRPAFDAASVTSLTAADSSGLRPLSLVVA